MVQRPITHGHCILKITKELETMFKPLIEYGKCLLGRSWPIIMFGIFKVPDGWQIRLQYISIYFLNVCGRQVGGRNQVIFWKFLSVLSIVVPFAPVWRISFHENARALPEFAVKGFHKEALFSLESRSEFLFCGYEMLAGYKRDRMAFSGQFF